MQFSQLGKQTTTKATEGPSPSSRQSTITGALSRTKYKQDSAKWCTLTDSVVCYIAKEMQPFNTIEKPEFDKCSKHLTASRNCLGEHTCHTAIPQLYNSMKDDTKGLGLLFLVVCNSSAIFANID